MSGETDKINGGVWQEAISERVKEDREKLIRRAKCALERDAALGRLIEFACEQRCDIDQLLFSLDRGDGEPPESTTFPAIVIDSCYI